MEVVMEAQMSHFVRHDGNSRKKEKGLSGRRSRPLKPHSSLWRCHSERREESLSQLRRLHSERREESLPQLWRLHSERSEESHYMFHIP